MLYMLEIWLLFDIAFFIGFNLLRSHYVRSFSSDTLYICAQGTVYHLGHPSPGSVMERCHRDMVSSELLHLLVLQGHSNILEYVQFLGYLSLSFLISKMVVVILFTLQSQGYAVNANNSAPYPACFSDHYMSELVFIHCYNKLSQKFSFKAIDIYSLLVLKCGESKPAPREDLCPGP